MRPIDVVVVNIINHVHIIQVMDVAGMQVLDVNDSIRVFLQFQTPGHVALRHQFKLIGQFYFLGDIAFCDLIQLARLEPVGKTRFNHVLAGELCIAGLRQCGLAIVLS